MTATPGSTVVHLDPQHERALIAGVLTALGATDRTAGVQADVLVEGDLRGHPSHGLQRLPLLVERIRAGLIDPATEGHHTWQSRSVVSVDGRHGLGPPVAMAALEAILGRVHEQGMALASIDNANHLGMLAPYVERAARRGVVAFATTTSEPLVHAWRGRHAVIGTNPIALGVPTSADPMILDMATAATSRGRVIDHANRGEPLAPGLVVDASGDPTCDPEAALDGAISPFGGAKGYALAAGLEFFVGALTNSALGSAVVGTLDADQGCNKGDVLMCFSPEVISGTDRRDTLSAFAEELRSALPARPDVPVTVPGDRARRVRQRLVDEARVPVSERVWAQVRTIATQLDLAIIDDIDEDLTS